MLVVDQSPAVLAGRTWSRPMPHDVCVRLHESLGNANLDHCSGLSTASSSDHRPHLNVHSHGCRSIYPVDECCMHAASCQHETHALHAFCVDYLESAETVLTSVRSPHGTR
jgi:hypothetical protein